MEKYYVLLNQYGLWAIALGSFFQSIVFVILAGILAARDVLNISEVIFVAAISAWLGHCFFYFLGYWLSKRRHLFSQSRIKRLINTLERTIIDHPWESVFLMQYGYGIRLISAIAFGFFKLSWGWFAWAQLLNCSAWALLLSFCGFFVGLGLFALPSLARLPTGITLISLFLFIFLFRKNRRSVNPLPTDRYYPEE